MNSVFQLFRAYGWRWETLAFTTLYIAPCFFLFRLAKSKDLTLLNFLFTAIAIGCCATSAHYVRKSWAENPMTVLFQRDDNLANLVRELKKNPKFHQVNHEISPKKILWVYGSVASESDFTELATLLATYRFGYINDVTIH